MSTPGSKGNTPPFIESLVSDSLIQPAQIDAIDGDYFADAFDEPPSDPDPMQTLRDAVEQLRDRPEPWACLRGQKRDVYDLLIDMGCSFDRTDDGPVPVPVTIGSLAVPIVADEQAPAGVVIAENADGTTARAWLRSRRSPEWFVVEDGRIIDQMRAERASDQLDSMTTRTSQEAADV